ncbi:ATP-dependent RecD-like DNA helicase [Lachnospiraceae bacterium]|nr:ATP-dependent RecD-like DNA helicase [Lachnospiraceae bacterium]
MNTIYRDIFRAIHEGKWLSIEYRNKEHQISKYWIGIYNLNPAKRTLKVEGLHLGRYTTETFDVIYIDSILSSSIVEGSYCPVNQELVRDIYLNPHKYKELFEHPVNLKILNYLEMCNRLDTVPYHSDFELIRHLDRESFHGADYPLNEEQFRMIVKYFQYGTREKKDGKLRLKQLAMNVFSIHTPRGLYVLAYRNLQLDVKRRVLHPEEDISICTEYTLDGRKENIRKYLDAEEYELLKEFAQNQEQIKDCITRHGSQAVDDMPYMIGLGMDILLDLHKEYEAVIEMYQKEEVTAPIRAFFGEMVSRPVRRKAYPIVLADQKVNLDQLLAINNAMKYPVAYIQGPPGTGKTSTIINTIVTAFFNEKTVLFASYNNHPINGVVEKLLGMKYQNHRIPFPALRLGSNEKMQEALEYIRNVYEQTRKIAVYKSTLDRNREDRIERAKRLSGLLRRYEERLDLEERRETIHRVLEFENEQSISFQMLPFQADLQGRQMEQVKRRIEKTGDITEEEAFSLLDDNVEELKKYLYYTSASYIKKIDLPRHEELKNIIFNQNKKLQLEEFARYLSKKENIRKLQEIFPIVATTCISAHKLGEPEPMFDMVIVDEASQCNLAVSLVPVIRGGSLMLVGDPQQLNPVIQLEELVNQKLRKKYNISEEYDYRKNSIYKTFLACDAVSDEILLHYHYRCHEKIIGFNNKKYYNEKLCIKTKSDEKEPLLYIDVKDSQSNGKNTAPAEVEEILRYAAANRDKTIGVITPFVNQRKLLEEAAREARLANVDCGTVHAFQGDEKDVVLFSTAITQQTGQGTYQWLKNNKELINVATSRARDKLVILADMKHLDWLHQQEKEDDFYELVQYTRQNGMSKVTQKKANSRALGVKPFSTETEEAFLKNLNHALENIWLSQNRFFVQQKVDAEELFPEYPGHQFDFVVYEKQKDGEIPVLAIELEGREQLEEELLRQRERQKQEISDVFDLQVIRVENSYARRYNHIKEILMNFFSRKH